MISSCAEHSRRVLFKCAPGTHLSKRYSHTDTSDPQPLRTPLPSLHLPPPLNPATADDTSPCRTNPNQRYIKHCHPPPAAFHALLHPCQGASSLYSNLLHPRLSKPRSAPSRGISHRYSRTHSSPANLTSIRPCGIPIHLHLPEHSPYTVTQVSIQTGSDLLSIAAYPYAPHDPTHACAQRSPHNTRGQIKAPRATVSSRQAQATI